MRDGSIGGILHCCAFIIKPLPSEVKTLKLLPVAAKTGKVIIII